MRVVEWPLFEPTGDGLCRMYLRPLREAGITEDTAAALVDYAARHVRPDSRACSCAYCIVPDIIAAAFALIARMDALPSGIVAIDGPCASGKTTLAAMLGEVFGASVFHMDDFFLRPGQRTPQRLAEPGGNVDRERFAQEVLGPLARGGEFSWRPYDCRAQALGAPVSVSPGARSIVEGAYSLHPALRGAYAVTAFAGVDAETQRERILRRNGEAMLRRFEREWIPLENAYFEAFDIAHGCDVVLSNIGKL